MDLRVLRNAWALVNEHKCNLLCNLGSLKSRQTGVDILSDKYLSVADASYHTVQYTKVVWNVVSVCAEIGARHLAGFHSQGSKHKHYAAVCSMFTSLYS